MARAASGEAVSTAVAGLGWSGAIHGKDLEGGWDGRPREIGGKVIRGMLLARTIGMVDWQMLEGIGGVATAIAVLVALAFGLRQLRDNERQRRDAAAFAVFANWSDPEALHALDSVYALPDAANPAAVEEKNDSGVVSGVYVRMELLGVMVHARMVSLDVANEWAGGGVRVAWRKLRPWIEAKRERAASERPGEWFQWLAERLAEHPARDEKVGAHVAHRAWRP